MLKSVLTFNYLFTHLILKVFKNIYNFGISTESITITVRSIKVNTYITLTRFSFYLLQLIFLNMTLYLTSASNDLQAERGDFSVVVSFKENMFTYLEFKCLSGLKLKFL